jgi:formylglycine-generating enzyme
MTSPTTRAPAKNMVWIAGGRFAMGSEEFYPEERPVHQAEVDGFWIDRHPVTVAEYRRFVKTTGYITLAERPPNPDDYPGAAPSLLVPGSAVFTPPAAPVSLDDNRAWWAWTPGAQWRHPEGPSSTLHGRDLHPVTHVAYEDALAYAMWAGKALPTETEWEFAARGGLDGAPYAWGDEPTPRGRQMANTWQGDFPIHNLLLDGFARTSPVGRFPPNGYDLVDMIGNVWEWTTTQFSAHHWLDRPAAGCCTPSTTPDPTVNQTLKGGSHLCAPEYCHRYRPAARSPQSQDSATTHIGFRCVVDV